MLHPTNLEAGLQRLSQRTHTGRGSQGQGKAWTGPHLCRPQGACGGAGVELAGTFPGTWPSVQKGSQSLGQCLGDKAGRGV